MLNETSLLGFVPSPDLLAPVPGAHHLRGSTGSGHDTSLNTAAPQGNTCCKHPKYPLCVLDYLPALAVLDGSLAGLLRDAAMEAALPQVGRGDSELTEAEILAADNWLLGSESAADSAVSLDPSASATNVTSTEKVR